MQGRNCVEAKNGNCIHNSPNIRPTAQNKSVPKATGQKRVKIMIAGLYKEIFKERRRRIHHARLEDCVFFD